MKLEFEYGHGLMSANLPDNTDVFIPGVTVPDPDCLPQPGTSCTLPLWSPSAIPTACPL